MTRWSISPISGARALALASILAAAAPGAAGGRDEPPLADLLQKVGAYAEQYEREFADLSAEESYVQKLFQQRGLHMSPPRTIKSDIVFMPLEGKLRWVVFRDVYEVDGKPVRDREARLEGLLANPTDDAYEKANDLLAESARYNVGHIGRNFNLPTLALVFLHPDNQSRFKLKLKGSTDIDGIKAWAIRYEEKQRPTFILDGLQRDLPCSGTVWVDAEGRVLRSHMQVKDAVGQFKAELTVRFTPWGEDHVWVPKQMDEMYTFTPALASNQHLGMREHPLDAAGQTDTGEYIEATAQYSSYHTFRTPKANAAERPPTAP